MDVFRGCWGRRRHGWGGCFLWDWSFSDIIFLSKWWNTKFTWIKHKFRSKSFILLHFNVLYVSKLYHDWDDATWAELAASVTGSGFPTETSEGFMFSVLLTSWLPDCNDSKSKIKICTDSYVEDKVPKLIRFLPCWSPLFPAQYRKDASLLWFFPSCWSQIPAKEENWKQPGQTLVPAAPWLSLQGQASVGFITV